MAWLASPAAAHHANEFFATGTAATLERGQVASYLTFFYLRPHRADTASHYREITPGFIYGITRRLNLEYHLHVLDPVAPSSIPDRFVEAHALEIKWLLRYALGRLPTMALSLEYELPTAQGRDAGSQPKLKPRLLFSRSLSGPFDVAASLNTAQQLGGPRKTVLGFGVGGRLSLDRFFRAGLEIAKEVDYSPGLAAIPSLTFEPLHRLKFRLGYQLGLSKKAGDDSLRFTAVFVWP